MYKKKTQLKKNDCLTQKTSGATTSQVTQMDRDIMATDTGVDTPILPNMHLISSCQLNSFTLNQSKRFTDATRFELAHFSSWNFNVFLLPSELIQLHFVQQLSSYFDIHKAFGVREELMEQFYVDVQQGYVNTPTQYHNSLMLANISRRYHTFLHAVDVMQSVAVFLRGFKGEQYITTTSATALLVAALCHDIGHLGLTNQYLVNSGNPLTLEYRHPVLESMHTAKTMTLLKKHNLLQNLEPIVRFLLCFIPKGCLNQLLYLFYPH